MDYNTKVEVILNRRINVPKVFLIKPEAANYLYITYLLILSWIIALFVNLSYMTLIFTDITPFCYLYPFHYGYEFAI